MFAQQKEAEQARKEAEALEYERELAEEEAALAIERALTGIDYRDLSDDEQAYLGLRRILSLDRSIGGDRAGIYCFTVSRSTRS